MKIHNNLLTTMFPRALIALLAITLLHNIVWALPEGAHITGGSGNIENNGTTLSVQQNSQKMSIDYSRFDIGKNETVRFIQPGREAIALNRVTGANPSEILGQLQANGQVFLINPNGILFGANAIVDVGGLMASTLQMSNSDFFDGNYQMSIAGNTEAHAEIINRGLIQASEQGYLALVSNHVVNEGTLTADKGSIELHSTDKVIVSLSQQAIAIESTQAAVDGLIENHGVISAEGGYILLNSDTLNTLHETVVNNTGVIRATSLVEYNGEIIIGGSQGDVFNDGAIDVSAVENDASGGDIHIDAARIAQRGELSANGMDAGNGGNINLHATDELFATSDSYASANGGTSGKGGETVYFSDRNALFAEGASIVARGGDQSGDGGFVEVSGLSWVGVKGFVDTRAPNGMDGIFLIDPTDIIIDDSGSTAGGSFGAGTWTSGAINATLDVDDIRTQLLTNNVIINTATADGGGPYGGNGDITVNAALDLDGRDGRILHLTADRDIAINANICDGGAICQATPDDNVGLFFDATGTFTMVDGVEINSGNNRIAITATAGAQITGLVSNDTSDNAINVVTTGGAITSSGDTLEDVSATAGGATLIASTGIDVDTNVTRLLLTNSTSGNIQIDNADSVDIANLSWAGGDATINTVNAGTDITVTNDIDIDGANGSTLTLNAVNDLIFNDAVGISDSDGADDAVNMNFLAGNDITLGISSTDDIESYGGNVVFNAVGDFSKRASSVFSQTGTISINADDIVVRGNMITTNTSSNAITVSGTTINDDGAPGFGTDFQANFGGIVLNANGTLEIDTDTSLLSVTNTGGSTYVFSDDTTAVTLNDVSGGSVRIDNTAGDINFNNVFDLDGDNGNTLTLNAVNNININANICEGGASCVAVDDNVTLDINAGNNITVTDGIEVHSGSNTINMVATGDITATGLTSTGIVVNAITLDAGNQIIQGGGTNTDVTALSGGVVLIANNGIGDGSTLRTRTTQMDITNTTSGMVDIGQSSGDINITGIDAVGAVDILVAGGANMTVTGFTTAGDLALQANRDLTINDGVLVDVGASTISLTAGAGGSVNVTGLKTSNATAGAVTITADQSINDGGNTNIDIDALNGGISLSATTGINDIETQGNTHDLSNTGSNAIIINDANNLNLSSLVTVGDVTLNAGTDLNVNNSIDLDGANGSTLTFDATNDLLFNSNVLIEDSTTGSADVVAINLVSGNDTTLNLDSQLQSYGGDIDIQAGGTATLSGPDVVNSGTGTIALTANDVAILGRLTSDNSTASAITINSVNTIVDGGASNLDISATSGGVQLNAGTGIQLDTDTQALNVTNTTSGDILIDNDDSLDITNLNWAGGNASINTLNTNADLTVLSNIDLDGLNAGETLTLNAFGALNINADMIDSAGPVDNDTNMVLIANDDITFIDSITVNSGTGTIAVQSVSNDVWVNELITTSASNAAITVSAGDRIRDNDSGVELNAVNGTVVLTAANGINYGGFAMEVNSAQLSLTKTTSGGVIIDARGDTDVVSIDVVSDLEINASSAGGNLIISSATNLGGDVDLIADSDLSIGNTVNLNAAAGNINLVASNGVLSLADSGITTLNNVSISGDDIVDSSGRDLDITANNVIYSASVAS